MSEVASEDRATNNGHFADGGSEGPANPVRALGAWCIDAVNNAGAAVIFLGQAVRMVFHRKQPAKILQQVNVIGAGSMTIVALVAFFTGMILGLQGYYTLVKFGSEGMLGAMVAISIIRELGPVLTAIMVVARAGSAMAAEIGILRISEQIDALTTMRIDPLRFVVSPRVAAAMISFPLLTALFDVVGIVGGYLSGVVLLGVDPGTYFGNILSNVDWSDVRGGFIKAGVFGVLVATICCYQGFFTHLLSKSHGAKGVSRSTTAAVVSSCVIILIADYVITSFLM